MFARAVCGLAVWVGMTGTAAAQTYGSGFPVGPDAAPRGMGVRGWEANGPASSGSVPQFMPAPAGAGGPAFFPRTDVTEPPAPPRTPLARLLRPQPLPDSTPPAGDTRGVRLSRPVALRADETPAPKPARPLPEYVPTPAELTGYDPKCGFDCADACGPPGRTWVGFEWLYWVTSGQTTPDAVTTAPAGTPRAVAGALGQPTTSTLFGGNRLNNDFRNGFRVYAGAWLNDAQTLGIEGDFFFLGDSRQGFAALSDGSQIITRPFVDAVTGAPTVELVSFPNVLAGRTSVDSKSSLLGAGVNGLFNLCCAPCGRLDFLLGYRYLNLVDQLTFREQLLSLPGQAAVPAGTQYSIQDRFTTRNNFHGGLIGLGGEWRFGHFFVGGRAAVSLGVNRQTTDIDGRTIITPPGGVPQVFAGGLYAQPSNIGHYDRSAFAVLPEAGLRVGVQLTDFARAYVGYNFLYLSNVQRAGDQVDPTVNPNFLPPRAAVVAGPARPAYTPKTTDFWAHGISVGLELRF
jgi:hypothetical protein